MTRHKGRTVRRGVLTDVTDQVRAEAQLERAAADTERARLSRDLHDSETQTLFSIAAIVAQAALNTVVKHAGASRAIVRLECTGE